ncbi:PadR family transcriptional regulator [Plantactinospora sp. WMMB334]|uniref:PadR family transcriptional regulator n=1 Tax=Plantactinospora sp. WMMB334 TaxID=3404119 RepID=UPI003B966816
MTTVFGHGRLRLYLLKLLDGGPRHGYELIRLLEERFLGLYAPSAGTIYPRLARLEAEGLVTHDAVGGRKVYRITEEGRAELLRRADELARLEFEIRASVSDLTRLAGAIRSEVRGSVRDLKQELRAALRQTRRGAGAWDPGATRQDAPTGAGAETGAGPGAGTGTGGGAATAAGPATGGGAGRGAGAAGDCPPGPHAEEWAAGDRANRAQGDDPGDEFDRELLAFVAEVRALARSGHFTENQLRTAARVLNGALDGLRRLLR